MPGGKRRPIDSIPRPSPQELYQRIKTKLAGDITKQAFASTLWISAAGVSEICQNKEKNWEGLKTINFREEPTVIDTRTGEKAMVSCLDRVYTEKYRKPHWRTIPTQEEDADDKPFIEIIQEYLKQAKEVNGNPNAPLFPFRRNHAFRIIKKLDPTWYPHCIRHWRLTYLSADKGYTDHDLRTICAWHDTRPASVYVKYDWRNIVRRHYYNK